MIIPQPQRGRCHRAGTGQATLEVIGNKWTLPEWSICSILFLHNFICILIHYSTQTIILPIGFSWAFK